MVLNDWADVVTRSFQDVWVGVVNFLPNFIVALLIFILGWIIGAILGKAVAQILRNLRFDDALRGAGFETVIERAGFRLDTGAFIGMLVKWFVIVIALIASLDILGLAQVNQFLQQVVLVFIPKVIVAVFILLVGAVIAEAMQNVVVASARSTGMRSAHFLGVVTRWAIWVFAGLAAIYQLGVATVFIQTIITGIMIAVALAVGLAFGLGGQEEARRYLERFRRDVSQRAERDEDRMQDDLAFVKKPAVSSRIGLFY